MSKLRDRILNHPKTQNKKVYVKAWDCDVYIRRLSAAEAMRFTEKDIGEILCLVIVDENGEQVFTDSAELMSYEINIINILSLEFKKHQADEFTREDIEELKKS